MNNTGNTLTITKQHFQDTEQLEHLLIQECYDSLSLCNLQINKISNSIIELKHFKNINASQNCLKNITLKNIVKNDIDFSYNFIENIEINNLTCENLNLHNNNLNNIKIVNSNIKKLILSSNNLSKIEFINTKIIELDLSNNELRNIDYPDNIEKLDLSLNNIMFVGIIPDTLTHLNFSHNKLFSIFKLSKNLIELDISYNEFLSFDVNILPVSLKKLDIRYNQIKNTEDLEKLSIECLFDKNKTIVQISDDDDDIIHFIKKPEFTNYNLSWSFVL